MNRSARILLASDAWRPQVNGVVRTWETTIAQLQQWGHRVEVVQPRLFPGFPCPFYPEIRLCRPSRNAIARILGDFRPDAIHIATEGPIGVAVRAYCLRNRLAFTTSYHTKFPEYLRKMVFVPIALSYSYMRWFHRRASAILVATPSLEQELVRRRFTPPIRRWSRGVDLELFYPRPKSDVDHWPRPILLYVGRVSKEKSIEDFLRVQTTGTKVVVGDGPIREQLERRFPETRFLGYRRGTALAEVYANADLFVFPSKTDTFGLVMIEALASGVPVAAYPVVGPIDIITNPKVGSLDNHLQLAVDRALEQGDPSACVAHARTFTWQHATQQLLNALVDPRTGVPLPQSTPSRAMVAGARLQTIS